MPLYEHVFMARQDVSPQQVESLTETFKTLITDGGGEVGKTEYWGLKSLAYRVRKNRKAHYTLMNIDAPADAVAEMERQMRLSDDIIRFLTLKVTELETAPSAMVKSRGRDDRGGRGRDRDRGDRGDRGGDRRRRDDDRNSGDKPDTAKADAPKPESSDAPKTEAPAAEATGEKENKE